MFARLNLVLVAAMAALIVAPSMVHAQDSGGRFRVMIPYFTPMEGANNNFGEDASEELRELMNTLDTHEAMEENDIEDELEELADMDMDELNCIVAVQLASAIGVPVAICAEYTEAEDQSRTVTASIRTITTSETMEIEPFTVPRQDGDELAAQRIFEAFDRYNRQVRATQFCGDYATSQQWQDALNQCDTALEINADATSTRFLRAQILRQLDRPEDALEETRTVLETDPFNEGALELAGYLATTLGDADAGREYYGSYLEMNPGNAAIRMRIAYDLAQAGDPAGAMQFIEVGLEVDPENPDLLTQYGSFAFSAARDAQSAYEMATPDAEGVAPDAREYYQAAIDAYTKVFEVRGAEMQEALLANLIRANIQLEQYDQAASLNEQFLEVHPESATLWSLQGDVLQRMGDLDGAIAALDRVLGIEPAHPTAALRQGQWLLAASRLDEAVAALSTFAEQNPDRADQAANLVFSDGYQNGQQQEDYAYSIRRMAAAKQIPNISAGMRSQLNFWHGFGMFQAATAAQEANTPESATATLPRFQEARTLLVDSGEYPSSVNVDLTQLLGNVDTYVEIQEAIIARANR